MMKKLLFVLLSIMALTSMSATTLLTDDFSGTVGTALTANGWTLHSGSGTPFLISTPGLSYTGYAGSAIGNAVTTGGTSDDNNKAFTSTNTGSLYLAFMYKATAASTTSDYGVMLAATSGASVTSFFGRFYVQKDASNNLRFGVTKTTVGSAQYTPYSYALNTTYLIIVKYDFVAGTANDVASLFVNPVLSGAEPAATVTGGADTAADPAQLVSVALRQSTSTAAGSYDGIRVFTAWSDIATQSLATEPTAQPTSLVFSSVTSTTMDVAFTAANPVADGYIAIRKSGSAPTTSPSDGVVYTAGTTLGDGTVAYAGSGVAFSESSLTQGTTYYYSIYSYNGTTGTINYLTTSPLSGSQATQVAIVAPTVTTATTTAITATTATSGGEVTATGGANVTARGICWGLNANPSLTDNVITSGSGIGTFVSNISGLSPLTTYHVRAYATNSVNTSYGLDVSFITASNSPPPAPVATTASTITQTSFVATWNASTGATSYKLDVSTSGTFASFLAGFNDLTVAGTSQAVGGLTAGATYYYRVRAVNTNGASTNSNVITVVTLAIDPYNGYYDTVTGLTGNALKDGLHNIIDNNTNTNYTGTKLQMFQVYDNLAGVVRCVYTGQDYTVNSSYDGSSNPNTEHTFAQSWFGTSEANIKKADGHHLFPTNSTVNSSRSNYPFDVVTSVTTTYPSYNSYVSKKGTNASGHIVFEPADQHKGNLARALMYFSVRYNMSLSIDGVDMLPTLLVWNNSDPVDAREQTRNTAVYNYQNNRNPFVDHPEYVSYIWGGSTPNTTISFSPASTVVNESAGIISLNVAIQNPSATTATTAQIQLTDGTATDVSSYTTQTITFPAGSSANQTITVTVTDDALLEGTETLVFTLTNISGGSSAVVGTYNTYNLTILDNDIPTVVATDATDISGSGFTANWNAAAGITDYEFDLATNAAFTSFVSGYEATVVTGTSTIITGLAEGTGYYYRVRAISNDTAGNNSNVITATTTTSTPGNVILTTGFEGSTSFPAGWTQNSSYIQTNATIAHGGTNYAGENSVGDWIKTPVLLNPSQMTFWASTSSGTSSWTVKVQSSSDDSNWNDMGTFIADGANTGDIIATYSQKTVTLNLTGSYYLRFYMSARTGGSFYLDDVEVTNTSVPVLPDVPVATAATAITDTGFTANWDSAANATSYKLDVSASETFSSFVTGYEDLAVSGLSQNVTGLSSGIMYYYRVRGVNTVGTSASSNVVSTTTTTTVPTVVALDATDITANGFTANWQAAAGATSYQFDLATDYLFSSIVPGYNSLSVSGTSVAVSGLTEAMTYYYRVRAVIVALPGSNSNVITTTTSSTTPVNVILSEGFEGAATATPPTGWTLSSAGSYILTNDSNAHDGTNYAGINALNGWVQTPALLNPAQMTFWGRASSATANFTVTVQSAPMSDPATWTTAATYVTTAGTGDLTVMHAQKTVALNLTGSYYIRWNMTVRSGGSFYFDDVEVSNSSEPVIPDVPVANAASDVTTTGFTANWSSAANATSYKLDVSASELFLNYISGYEDLTVLSTSQAVDGLTDGTPYYYRVRSTNSVGTSVSSNVITVNTTTSIPTVTATDATSILTTGFTANWDDSVGADSYQFDLATDILFTAFVDGYNALGVTGTSLVVTGLSEGTGYYYRLRAVVGGVTGLNSNIITVTTGMTLPENVIISEGFEGASTTVPPTDWALPVLGAYILTNASNAHTGTNYAGANKINGWIRTPLITNPAQVTFWGRTSANTAVYSITLQTASVSDSTIWTPVASYSTNLGSGDLNMTYTNKSVALNLTGDYYLRWYMTSRTTGSFYLDDVVVTYTPSIVPETPVAIAATEITPTSFVANWNAVTNATSYRLDVSLNNTFSTYIDGYQDLIVNGTSSEVTGLAEGTMYFYRLRAVNEAGTSLSSNLISLTTSVVTPVIETPVVSCRLENGDIYLSWPSIPAAVSFRVEEADAPDGVYSDVTENGFIDEADGVVFWTATPTSMQKFYRVIAISSSN